MYAFGLVETGFYREAEKCALKVGVYTLSIINVQSLILLSTLAFIIAHAQDG